MLNITLLTSDLDHLSREEDPTISEDNYNWLNVPEGFELGIATTDEEIDELVQFNNEIHGESAGVLYKRIVKNIPGFSDEMNSYIRDSDTGKIVSSVTAIPSQWSYDGVTLENLEVGFVGTSPNYRNRGFFGILYSYFDRLLQEKYDISSIQGIPYFYRKYGYDLIIQLGQSIHLPVRVIPDFKLSQDSESKKITIRTVENEDLNTLKELFEETNQKLLVSTTRSDEMWKVQEHLKMGILIGGDSAKFETYLIEKEGTPDGYIRMIQRDELDEPRPNERVTVMESSIRSYETVMWLLSHLKKIAQDAGLGIVEIPGDIESNLGTLALDYGGRLVPFWKYQIRIPNLTRFLNKIRPVLKKRLIGTMFENLTKEIFINTYRSCHRLNFVNGILDPIEDIGMQQPNTYSELRFPPEGFIRLMFGEYSIDELMKHNSDFIVGRGYRSLLESLFPKKESFVYYYYC